LALIAPPKPSDQTEQAVAAEGEMEGADGAEGPPAVEVKEPSSEGGGEAGEPEEGEANPEANGDLEEVEETDEEQVFDENYHLDAEVKEYKEIEQIFKAHNIPYSEEKLKAAIIWNNRIHPEKEKKVDYAQGRYPDGLSAALMVNPFKEDKKKGKKKKKK